MNRILNQLSFLSKILLVGAVSLLGIAGVSWANSSTSQSKVPMEYFANYQIQKSWDRLLEIFIEIDADAKIGKIGGSTLYGELHTIMSKVFPYFPQDYNFQVVYKQCQRTTKDMQSNPDKTNFDSFMENCKNPLAAITNTIKSKYTVKASATLNPSSGPAPLTVTFDARASKDPSNETIPSRNYFWYYRDIDGQDKPIGYGAVVNYKFKESGTYLVHLTVRSSNTGIFDGEATVSVNVSPKSANVIVYANGKQMNKNKYIKIGVQEAKRGVVFDGSATLPMGGREILSHKWEISSRDGFKWFKEGDGKPGYINLPLPSQGEFAVSLSVVDNEKNTVSEKFSLSVSDPVAIIQQNPDKGTTATTYGFSAAASYSLTSRLKLYTWELFDSEGVKLDTLQGKEIKKQFKKPGNYTVKLTVEDEIGNKNIDTINVYVESTPPVPQFTITPTTTWLYPSEFHLNAQSSNDLDVVNGFDSLKYDRKFSNQNAVQITENKSENQQITVLFNQVGTHQVTLTVSDKYGKISEITKDIVVQSVLRPHLTIRPKAAVLKTYVTFLVKTNVPIINYEWDFGDGNIPRSNQTNVMKHEYQRVGNYKVTLKVTDESGNTNTVYDTVYIGEKNEPIISYDIKNEFGIKLAQNDQCEDEKGNIHNAYRIDRQARFNIDTSSSVNTQGNANQLRYYFQVENDDTINTNNFSYKFNGLGCQYIDYTLEDTSVSKTVKERIWFKVVNALPKLSNVSILFPQYGNEIGIGFQQANKSQDIFNSGVDPIIIRVNAEGAVDTDGAISYFKRYYYPKNNPNKILETRVSPGNVPYTYFSVPKQPGEFMFGVKMFDNDDGYQTSEDILGNGPIVLFPDAGGQPDIPIVTLKTNTINAEVGEEVTFDVVSKILSDRSDFIKERVIQIDFEGDGIIDLTTKNDRIKHVYTKPSNIKDPYKPIAYVTYRDYKGRGESASIVVKNGIKPALIYGVIGTTVFFKDVSIGNLIERNICWDTAQCQKGNTNYSEHEVAERGSVDQSYLPLKKNIFKVSYPKPGVYTVEIKAKDSNANEATNTLQVKVGENADTKQIFSGLQMLALPTLDQSDKGQLEILLSRQLNNEVLLYLKTDAHQDKCWIDTDITKDANFDGIPDNDGEYGCNRILNIPYTPITETVIGRIFYQPQSSSTIFKKDFSVRFSEFEQTFPNETFKTQYAQLTKLIASIDDSGSVANADLRNLLIILKNDLVDINRTRSSVIQIEDFLAKKQAKLTQKQEDKLNEILVALSDHATLSAKGGSAYEVAKLEILALLPTVLQNDARKQFQDFESPEKYVGKSLSGIVLDVKTVREMALSNIYTLLSKNAVDPQNIGQNQIGNDDFKNIVLPNLCEIAESYTLNAPYCGSQLQTPTVDAKTDVIKSPDGAWPTWLKVLLWIVGIAVLAFVGIIVAFAIKAKLREKYDEEE